jgi:hypothetical protein
VYTLNCFGRRPADPELEPAPVYGSTQIELACTILRLIVELSSGRVAIEGRHA